MIFLILEVFLLTLFSFLLFLFGNQINNAGQSYQNIFYQKIKMVLGERIDATLAIDGKNKIQSNSWWTSVWNQFRISIVVCFLLFCCTRNFLLLIGPPLIPILYYYLLIRSARLRKQAILRRIPFVLDLLILNLESGLDFVSSLDEICRIKDKNPLNEEIRWTLQSIHLGESRSKAFENLANRTQVNELKQLCFAIQQSEAMGSSLTELLRLQCNEVRHRIFKTAESEAQKAPVKILIPMLLFIFPVVFIILLVPIGMQVYDAVK